MLGEKLAAVMTAKFEESVAGASGQSFPPQQPTSGPGSPTVSFTPWQLQQIKALLADAIPRAPPQRSIEGSSPKLPKLRFARLHRFIQEQTLAMSGMLGPLPLLGAAHYPPFMAWLAVTAQVVVCPIAWWAWLLSEAMARNWGYCVRACQSYVCTMLPQ